METNIDLPYVVQGDLRRLMKQWWTSGGGVSIPNTLFFEELRKEFYKDFHRIFGRNLYFLHEESINQGLAVLIGNCERWIVPIDRVFYQGGPVFDITRRIDRDLKNWGLGPRGSSDPLPVQVREYVAKLKRKKINTIWLLDDAVYTGNEVWEAANLFESHGLVVEKVIAGVAIGKGIERMRRRNPPVDVRGAYEFPEALDIVHERDFYVGVPLSGANVKDEDEESVPYVNPWGKGKLLVQNAHIPPEWVEELSQSCILRSLKLWERCEEESELPLRCEHLPMKVPGFRLKERVVKAFERLIMHPDQFDPELPCR